MLLLVLSFILKDIYLIVVFFILIIVALSITLYCLRYLYAEGVVLHILQVENGFKIRFFKDEF